MPRPTPRPAIALSALLLLPALRARADDPLPKAEAVLDQYVEATGGKAAYEKIKSRVVRGTVEIAGAGLKGTFKETAAAPDKSVEVTEIPGQIKGNEGTDGRVVWETSDVQGPRVLEGVERETKLREATFNKEVRWREVYPKAECTGVEDVAGKPAYRVVLTPKSGKPITQFYDKASHLLVKQTQTEESPRGVFPVELTVADYRKVDGVLLPHKITAKLLTFEMVMVLTEVKHNVDLPADAFKVPDDVKALLDKKKDGK